jgi:8-oxo-dGTP pyrophosphatase MutT (NUDIX family)
VTAERPAWLRFAERVQAIAQTGLAYARDPYDRERYEFRGDELLRVRERRSGRFTFPGGWADVGDTPGAAGEPATSHEIDAVGPTDFD